jgi:hypothetical protein
VLLVIRRGITPHEETCTLTVVNPSVAAVPYHATDGQSPPKLKMRTCLELGGLPLARLRDEAWWVALWFGMNISLAEVASGKLKRSPLKVPYELALALALSLSLALALALALALSLAQGAVRGAAPFPLRRLPRPIDRQVGRGGRTAGAAPLTLPNATPLQHGPLWLRPPCATLPNAARGGQRGRVQVTVGRG